ncbi:hypothetical protein O4M77_15720 (plasmid) [Acinetobacter sp. YWS30-1]|uniref:hypothetical protein n=1 Tax=Acinetobacter TaxID=469 RepID=UPI00097FCF9D|nr:MULTISPECIES: hypothetical protein [Acinetobacter]APW49188.1 hypothetical protein ABVS_3417 [Acinetobacter lwoffii]WPC36497.1 hypothetical protein O4M77_15720 [Acinetobacter sp. YWS30-1]
MKTSDNIDFFKDIDFSKFISNESNVIHNYLLSSSSKFESATDLTSHLSIEAEKNSKKLIRILKQDEFVPGELNKTQLFLENLLVKNKDLFREVFQKTWLQIFPEKNTIHIINFISMASYFDYDVLDDRADVLVISGCSHIDIRVNEAAIRAIESWEQKKHIDFLKAIKPTEVEWLESYKSNVIKILELM